MPGSTKRMQIQKKKLRTFVFVFFIQFSLVESDIYKNSTLRNLALEKNFTLTKNIHNRHIKLFWKILLFALNNSIMQIFFSKSIYVYCIITQTLISFSEITPLSSHHPCYETKCTPGGGIVFILFFLWNYIYHSKFQQYF